MAWRCLMGSRPSSWWPIARRLVAVEGLASAATPVMFARSRPWGRLAEPSHPTYQPGMTLERYAAWHAEVAQRVRDWQQRPANWWRSGDETDYYRVRDGGALAVEFAALTKTPVSDNPCLVLR